MKVVTIIIIVVLCLVAGQVIGIVAYIAAKRYYYEKLRRKMHLERLKKLAIFIPAASARIDKLKKQVKHGAQKQVQETKKQDVSRRERVRSYSLESEEFEDEVLRIHEPDNNEPDTITYDQSHSL